ncbi:hypothetical protein [Flexivirga lutea]
MNSERIQQRRRHTGAVRALTGSVILAGVLTAVADPAASASDRLVGSAPCFGCGFQDNDAYVGLTISATKSLPRKGKSTVAEGKKPVVKLVPYEYRVALACPANNDPEKNEVGCEKAFKTCIDVKDAEGPLKTVFRRLTEPKGKDGWHNVGETCWPKLVPGVKSKPELTVAMIRSEFIRTPFVRPKATMEPVGNRTLVNLPNYFTADFSGAGYGPDEVRTVTLLGHQVRIKPVLKSNTFHFGEGASLGPTESRGGGYPDGDVRHTYAQRGTVNASVTTVYGGQFSVDGGPFTDLPGTATITGPAQPIQVLEATGRLVR